MPSTSEPPLTGAETSVRALLARLSRMEQRIDTILRQQELFMKSAAEQASVPRKPDDIQLPLSNKKDLDDLESKLQDDMAVKELVSIIMYM